MDTPSAPGSPTLKPQSIALTAQSDNEVCLKILSAVEQRVIQLLNDASEAVAQLANEEDPEEAEHNFAARYESYVQTLHAIQSLLRRVFRKLSTAGILAAAGRSIPYHASLAGDEKDFELAAKSVALVLAEVEVALEEVRGVSNENDLSRLNTDDMQVDTVS